MTNTIDIRNSAYADSDERPWWNVRRQLLATLGLLVTILLMLWSRPQFLEQILRLTGM